MDILTVFEPVIKVFHFLAAIVLVVSILLQPGKGASLGAAFGIGASETLFGAQGSTKFLSRVTVFGALLFLITSMSLAFVAKNQSGAVSGAPSVVDTAVPPQETGTAPTPSGQAPATSDKLSAPQSGAPSPDSPGAAPAVPSAPVPATPKGPTP